MGVVTAPVCNQLAHIRAGSHAVPMSQTFLSQRVAEGRLLPTACDECPHVAEGEVARGGGVAAGEQGRDGEHGREGSELGSPPATGWQAAGPRP